MQMTVVHEHLFFVKDNQVTVYRFWKDKEKFEHLRRDGSITYPITEDFWEWWKEAVDYSEDSEKEEDSDQVDFCFIYDKENILISDSFLENVVKKKEESLWNRKVIRAFFEEIVESTHVELHYANDKVECFDKKIILFAPDGNQKKIYYTNLMTEMESSKEAKEKTEDKEEVSLFTYYFNEVRKQEMRR